MDDTPCPREGPKIEGLGVQHGLDGFVKGLCAVTALLVVGSLWLIWAIQGYRGRRGCLKEELEAREKLLFEILNRGIFLDRRPTVLMDTWYLVVYNSCRRLAVVILNFIKESKLDLGVV